MNQALIIICRARSEIDGDPGIDFHGVVSNRVRAAGRSDRRIVFGVSDLALQIDAGTERVGAVQADAQDGVMARIRRALMDLIAAVEAFRAEREGVDLIADARRPTQPSAPLVPASVEAFEKKPWLG